MFQICTVRALFVSIVVFALPLAARAQQAVVAADAFVDSVGVNLHLHYFGTAYDQWPTVRSRVVELGVRHVRDGLIHTEWRDYYERYDSLAQAGIKAIFIVDPNQSTELWASYPARMPRAFGGYEAPNELNKSGDPNWAQVLRQTMVRLRSLRNDPRSAAFPVIGPSLSTVEAYAELGDVSAYFDAGNMHNYMGGRYPGTTGWGFDGHGSIAANLANAQRYTGGKPVITTENGYHHDTSAINAIPQEVAGRYMPRLLMEQYRAGIPRTYIYELADWSAGGSYGLLNDDLSPKPAYTAVKSLLNLLSDPGPAFTPQGLGYSIQGGTSNVRHMLFQKRDGTYYLAIWIELASYHNEEERLLTVPPENVTVNLDRPLRVTRTHRWQNDGSLSTATAELTTTAFPIEVADALTVIELAPVGVGTGGSAPGVPSLTASVTNRTVQLRWQRSNEGSTPTGYIVEASVGTDFANLVRFAVGGVTELAVPNVAPGVYFARIRAANTFGESVPSNVVPIIVGVPAPPQLVALRDSANPIALSWSSGSGARQYVLSAGTSPGSSDVGVVSMGMATQVAAQVPHGVRYYVRVAAVNEHGASRSNEVSVVVSPPQLPGPPTLEAAQVSGRRVALSWAPGAGGAVDGYVLAVGTSPGAANLGTFNLGGATQIGGDSPVAGQLFVRVYARNAAGATVSNEISFSVP